VPDTELIQDIEDRQFNTSLGHWTGDAIWTTDPIWWHGGVAWINLPNLLEQHSMKLQYPYVKAKPGRPHNINFYIMFGVYAGKIHWKWKLTDGIYIHQNTGLQDIANTWYPIIEGMTLEPGWTRTSTQLEIAVYTEITAPTDVWLDDFSLQYEPSEKLQYLPVMGAG
jgi:hypothetical protein